MRTLIISARPSNSATALARALGIRKLATEGIPLRRPVRVLSWGSGTTRFMERYGDRLIVTRENNIFLNNPVDIDIATNKLLTFQRLAEDPAIPIPEFTADSLEALRWRESGTDVVGRHVLTGHSGEGIELFPMYAPTPLESSDAVLGEMNCPLYVKYMKKKHEYRVHVILNDEVSHTDIQQKRKRQETPNEEVDYKVRNYQNGWVYCREELATPPGIRELAVRVVRQLGLDFGAVDIIWNQQYNQMTVLEVNTAPGLEGQTLEFYREHLGELISN